MESESFVPINPNDLAEYSETSGGLLRGVSWEPKVDDSYAQKSETAGYVARSTRKGKEEISLIQIAEDLDKKAVVMPDDVNHVLNVLQDALNLGMYVNIAYTKTSGLEDMIRQQKGGEPVKGDQEADFRNKTTTASAVGLFTTAYYVVWQLSRYKMEDVSEIQMDFDGLPELRIDRPVSSMTCMMFYYGLYLRDSGVVKNGLDWVKLTLLYFQAVIDEIQLKQDSFREAEFFTKTKYRLEGSNFCLRGFNVDVQDAIVSTPVRPVKLEEIVGNREAKRAALRLIQRLFAFDFETKQNPFVELRALTPFRMGYGIPGTGKSMLNAAIATLLMEWSDRLGIPSLYHPMPEGLISSFQGKSARATDEWFMPMRTDTSRIIYAAADDAENNFEDRTRQGVSEGVKGVIGVFLRFSEGASSIYKGNWAFDFLTNIAEIIDPAVMSRIGERFPIHGAETVEDFLDQDFLWWDPINQVVPNFVDLAHPDKYQFMSAQQYMNGSILEEYPRGDIEPHDKDMSKIFCAVRDKYPTSSHYFFAELFARVHGQYENFSSRDVRNIQRQISGAMLDFDLHDVWMTDPNEFYRQVYARKVVMLQDFMREMLQKSGLTFEQLRLSRVVKYLDSVVEIAERGRRRRLEEMVEDLRLRNEALAIVKAEA